MPPMWKTASRVSASGGTALWPVSGAGGDETQLEALLEEIGVAEVLAAGDDAAFQQDGVDVLAAGAAEGRVARGKSAERAGHEEMPDNRSLTVAALLDHLGVGLFGFHVGEDQDADEEHRDQDQERNQNGYGLLVFHLLLRGRQEGHGDCVGFLIGDGIGQDGEVADEFVAAAGGAGDFEFSLRGFAGLHSYRDWAPWRATLRAGAGWRRPPRPACCRDWRCGSGTGCRCGHRRRCGRAWRARARPVPARRGACRARQKGPRRRTAAPAARPRVWRRAGRRGGTRAAGVVSERSSPFSPQA